MANRSAAAKGEMRQKQLHSNTMSWCWHSGVFFGKLIEGLNCEMKLQYGNVRGTKVFIT